MSESSAITDRLLDVYNYCFVETVPYEFFKPNEKRDIAVNLKGKEYRCKECGKVTYVPYRQNGCVYFSKGKLDSLHQMYGDLGLDFPERERIDAGEEVLHEAVGYCEACAKKRVQQDTSEEQQIICLSEALHQEDELLAAKGKAAMEQSLKNWLESHSLEEILKYDMSSLNAVSDFICAVILEDVSELNTLVESYNKKKEQLISEIADKLEVVDDKWKTYVPRPSAVYESMNDKMYHEYTVVFPEEDAPRVTYYIFREVEKSRVRMFLEQKRIETTEELMRDVGFHGEWIDILGKIVEEKQKMQFFNKFMET